MGGESNKPQLNELLTSEVRNRITFNIKFLSYSYVLFFVKVTFSSQSGNTTFLLKNILHLLFVCGIEQIIVTLFYLF